jgi:hypothetical protein
VELGTFILDKMERLKEFREVLLDLSKEGDVSISVGWFSDSNASAALLAPEVLKACSDLGIGSELNCYFLEEET